MKTTTHQKLPQRTIDHLDTHNHPHLRPLVQTRKNKYTCTHRDFAYIHVYAQKYHLKLHAIFFEPSKKVKAKNLAERGPKFFKIQKIQKSEDKKNYSKMTTFY